MQEKNISRVVAAILVIIGMFLFLSLSFGDGSTGFAAAGYFLSSSFSYAAWLVPLYFVAAAVLLLIDRFRVAWIVDLNYSLIPFLTLALMLRVMFTPEAVGAPGFVLSSFGQFGGLIVLTLLFFLEILLFLHYRARVLAAISGRVKTNGISGSSVRRGPFRTSGSAARGASVNMARPAAVEDGVSAAQPDTDRVPSAVARRERDRRKRELEVAGLLTSGSGSSASPRTENPQRGERFRRSAESGAHDSGENEPEWDEGFTFRVPRVPELPELLSLNRKPVEDDGMFVTPEVLESAAEEADSSVEDQADDGDSAEYGTEEFADVEETGYLEDVPEDEQDPADEEDAVFEEVEESAYADLNGEYEVDEYGEDDAEDEVDDASGAEDECDGFDDYEAADDEAGEDYEDYDADGEGDGEDEEEDDEDDEPDPSESHAHIIAIEKRRPIKPGKPYSVPVQGILKEYEDSNYWVIDDETKNSAEVLKNTLQEFNIKAEVTGIRKGPVITMFEILPAPGVKLSKITNLADNIALRLAASSVRIVAPIPGKHAVGIEVPNAKRAIVSFSEMLSDESFTSTKTEIPIALGKDIAGGVQIMDLVQTPHLLIAGATGSGKSVCVNSLICSVLYRRAPDEVRLLLIDPKIVELKFYNDIPHLLTPVITEPKKAFQALQWCIYEMERRYSLLDALGVRDIRSYNRRIRDRNLATTKLPYIVVIIDEFADLMATTGKELESTLARLAAMSRAVGIHLVLATQRPSIDVITGLIKANIPSRIAFMVASKFDSRIIIDAVGAEKLLGRGDMLFASAWDPFPVRLQGAYLSEDEVERVVTHVKTLGAPEYIDDEIFIEDDEEDDMYEEGEEDPLTDKAIDIVVTAGKASASYLQRRLKIGYNRAARLVENLEYRGIVGPQNGSKPREILHIPDNFKQQD